MRKLEHVNIVKLKYFFYSAGEKVRARKRKYQLKLNYLKNYNSVSFLLHVKRCANISSGRKRIFNLRLISTLRYSSFENVNFLTNQHCILDNFAVDIHRFLHLKEPLLIWSIIFLFVQKLDTFNFKFWFQKDEVFLNLVLEYVPETVYRVARHYSKSKQTIPVLYIKVCTAMWQLIYPNIIFIKDICKYFICLQVVSVL